MFGNNLPNSFEYNPRSNLESRRGSDKESSQISSIAQNISSELSRDSQLDSLVNTISHAKLIPVPCTHPKAREYVCLTHKEKICSDCMASGIHFFPDHDIKPLKSLEESVHPQVKRLKDLSLEIPSFSREMKKIYEKQKKTIRCLIKEKFGDLKYLVKTKEAKLLSEIDLFFDHEIVNLLLQTGENSLIQQVIDQKVYEYQQITQVENPFEILDQDLSIIFEMIKKATNSQKRNEINEKLQEMKQKLDSELSTHLSNFEKISENLVSANIAFNLTEELSSREELAKYKSILNDLPNLIAPLPSSQSSITIQGRLAQISYPFHGSIHSKIDGGENISTFDFKLLKDIEEVSQEDASTLCLLRFNFPNIREISIALGEHKISDHALLEIFSCLFWRNQSLESLSFTSDMKGKGKALFEKSLLYLAENILLTTRNLQKFYIRLEDMDLTSQSCGSLNERISQLADNLTDLHFACRCTNVDFVALQKLFVSMPNLTSFKFSTNTQRSRKQVFEAFVEKTLPSLKNLKDFQLSIRSPMSSSSTIDDHTAKKLLTSIPKEWALTLNHFEVNFNLTMITDESLQEFLNGPAAKFEFLQKLKIFTSASPGVTPTMRKRISEWKNNYHQ